MLHRTARQAAPTYTALCQQVRESPVVTPDETGWRVGAMRHWLWAFATPQTTVYAIRSGRGFDDAATVLGTDFAGVLVRDGWAPYRRFTHALHQSCLAHLIRRARQLRTDHPRSPWAARVQAVLQAALKLRDRRDAGLLSDHGLATARGRLLAQLGRLIDKSPTLDAADRFAAHLDREFAATFAFLWDPSIDATNWRAEQAIRPAVVTRKVCGGNRTRHGADTQQVLASVVRHRLPASTRPRPSDHHDASLFQPRRSRHAPTVAPVDQRAVLPIRNHVSRTAPLSVCLRVAVEEELVRPRSSNHPGKQRLPGLPDRVSFSPRLNW